MIADRNNIIKIHWNSMHGECWNEKQRLMRKISKYVISKKEIKCKKVRMN